MRKIKVVVLLVQQLQHGFTKNAKVSPNLTVAHSAIVKKTTSLNIWIARSVVDQYYGLSVVKCRYLAYEFATKNNVNMPDNWAREGKAGVEWMSSQLMMSS